jgi:hypothetical protein
MSIPVCARSCPNVIAAVTLCALSSGAVSGNKTHSGLHVMMFSIGAGTVFSPEV